MKKILASTAIVAVLAAAMSVSVFAATEETGEVVAEEIMYNNETAEVVPDASELIVDGASSDVDGNADVEASTEGTADTTVVTGAEEDKGSPDTGVEGIAVVAGAAVFAGGIALMTLKKRD